jgi:2-oxoglutarate dehydrogenase E1 component
MSDFLDKQSRASGYFGANIPFIEALYEDYLKDPGNVSEDWRRRFERLPPVDGQTSQRADLAHHEIQASLAHLAHESGCRQAPRFNAAAAERQVKVLRLINAYRVRGHQSANLDPLALHETALLPELSLSHYGFSESDLDETFNTGSLFAPERLPLRDILEIVRSVYTGTVGSEYMHITSTREKRWIQQRLETYRARPELEPADKRWLLHLLTAAEGMEKFMHARFVGQKRFSLEGGESLIPLLDELVVRAAKEGAEEIVIGMAHRGRLNVLANIIAKPPGEIFQEFEGQRPEHTDRGILSSGDVKYHKGFSSDLDTPHGPIHVTLGFNPSHLEIINPVIMGSVRARQQRYADHHGDKIIPVVIHGDAAIAGQGVNQETFNMSQARGYSVGGTVHVVVNNQIGFTTSNLLDSRSTHYCTDIAKMVQAPIFHVNGDDPEAVLFVTRLAFDYRMRFHKDVVIDLVCYRRQGHNEADEPAVTQPVMYRKIRTHPPVRSLYADRLIAEGVITPEAAKQEVETVRDTFERGESVGRSSLCDLDGRIRIDWKPFRGASWDHPVDTRVDADRIAALAGQIFTPAPDFPVHPRLARILEDRQQMATGSKLMDWGFAENMAYACLLDQGYPVRISGQDVRRGTFFHRHAMWRNQETGESYIPLQHLKPGQPHFVIIDSVLSEEAVLAYEYGYASAEPNGLTIWEAQFGDFANGAQVVIDQFITSAGAKWGLYCGLTLFLPHGYEGQGPEHSSARMERYLQACAEHNIQVCVPTTPAQIFHLLMRQMLRPFRHPLVVLTPKSLLRSPLATSPIESLSQGAFETVIDEIDAIEPDQVTQLILCTGKVYYDLLQARRSRRLEHVAIIRIEQLYPFPKDDFCQVIRRYPKVEKYVWCQEEPQNQGAWDQIKHRFHAMLDNRIPLVFAGRRSAAAPATGYFRVHQQEQEKLVDDALTGFVDPSMNRRG